MLYALTAGLLAEGLLVQAAWSGRQEGVALQSPGDCRALLLQLFQAFPWKGEKMPGGPGKGLFLDLDGRLFSNGREVCRFSAEESRAELEETIVSL